MRNSSIHAAAVVIADRPLTDIVPLQLADAGTDENGDKVFRTVTQFSMKPIEQIGILKMDFLGLRNLDVIEDALDIIERSSGQRPDMTTLPLDDARTYEMLARGDSTGVFQFESEGMRDALKKVKPDEFNDLIALGALYRPGAMDQIPVYAKGKRNPQAITYPDERLREILESSKGVILYQEQAMQISKELAGFSGAKADDLRKAIGKKNRQAMAALKPEFVEGCRASGTSSDVTEALWQTNERAGRLLLQQEPRRVLRADLLPHRLAEGELSGRVHGGADLLGDVDEGQGAVLRRALRGDGNRDPAARREPLRPRVHGRRGQHPLWPRRGQGRRLPSRRGNQSSSRGWRRVRLAVGLLRARRQPRGQQEGDRGARQVRRARLDESDSQGDDGSPRAGAGVRSEDPAGRADRPGLDLRPRRSTVAECPGRRRPGASLARPVHPPISPQEFDQAELLAVEKEAIGLFISAHPLKPLREALRARVDCPLAALADRRDKDWVTVGGIIVEAKRIKTRNGDHMMFATLDDLAGSVEILVFGKAMAEYEAALAVDEVVLIKGRVDHKEAGKTCLVVQSVDRFAPTQEEIKAAGAASARAGAIATAIAEPVCLRVDASALGASAIEDLKQAIEEYPGPAEVVLEVDTSAGVRRLRLGEAYRVQHTPTLLAELEHALAPALPAAAAATPERSRLAGSRRVNATQPAKRYTTRRR